MDLTEELSAAYWTGVRWVDTQLAATVTHLEQWGLLENALLVVTSDHGEAFGEHGSLGHGRYLYDELVRVPMVMHGPPPFDGGRVIRPAVGLVDVMPTFLDWAGLAPLGEVEGRPAWSRRCPSRAAPPHRDARVLVDSLVMITKAQLLDSMRLESDVIKHLATKVTPDKLDWRPTPVQRSMLELLQYMTRMSLVAALHAVTDGWDHAEALEKETEGVTLETFADEMDLQMARLEVLMAEVDEDEATTQPTTMPWGTPTTVAAGLMDMALKCYVAYRMQLFLYVKASGLHDLGPANCWMGVDAP